ncbi:MAG: hypothetical protein ABR915_25315, partial [Thermoguttaceae bacterium]
MKRRTGVMLATLVATLFFATDAVWACRCLDRVMVSRCGRRCCQEPCCCWTQPPCCACAVCLPSACGPVGCCAPAAEGVGAMGTDAA